MLAVAVRRISRTILRVGAGVLARTVLLCQTNGSLSYYACREKRERGQCRSEGQHIVIFHARSGIPNVEGCHSEA